MRAEITAPTETPANPAGFGSIPMLGSSFKTPRGFTACGVLVVRNLLVREATLKFLAQLKARDLFADLSAEEMEASSDIQRFE